MWFGPVVDRRSISLLDCHIDAEVERIALVDTFKDEAEESLRLAEALGEKLWGREAGHSRASAVESRPSWSRRCVRGSTKPGIAM